MKIKVPTYCTANNLTDHELVFCNLMLFLAVSSGWKGYRYYMWSDDIKHILGITIPHPSRSAITAISLSNIAPQFTRLKKLFKIGTFNNPQWFVQFPDSLPDEMIAANGHLLKTEVEITDMEAIKVYYYLAGRLSGTEQIINSDIKRIDPDLATPIKSSVLHSFYKDHMMI